MGMKGELVPPPPEDRNDPEPEPVAPQPDPLPLTPEMAVSDIDRTMPAGVIFADDDDDGELEPWEKYRNDMRYDINGDGVVDENDFPDWRSAGK
jgi:hypothetical protein